MKVFQVSCDVLVKLVLQLAFQHLCLKGLGLNMISPISNFHCQNYALIYSTVADFKIKTLDYVLFLQCVDYSGSLSNL